MKRTPIIYAIILFAALPAASQISFSNYNIWRCDFGDLASENGGPGCPVIDGSMGDAAWSYTGLAQTYIPMNGPIDSSGRWKCYGGSIPSTEQSSVGMTYDANYIYIGMRAPDLAVNTYCGVSDVWQGDSADMWFDIDGGPGGVPDYLDFWRWSFSTVCESSAWYMMQGAPFWDWFPTGMQFGGAVGEGIEVRLPFDTFQYESYTDPLPGNPPSVGTIWGYNACRTGDSCDSCWHLGWPWGPWNEYMFGTITFQGGVGVAADSPVSWGEIKKTFK